MSCACDDEADREEVELSPFMTASLTSNGTVHIGKRRGNLYTEVFLDEEQIQDINDLLDEGGEEDS